MQKPCPPANYHISIKRKYTSLNLGDNSRIEELAKAINGHIVQMSGAYWPVQVAKILAETVGYRDSLLDLPSTEIEKYLKERISQVPYENLLDMPAFNILESEE